MSNLKSSDFFAKEIFNIFDQHNFQSLILEIIDSSDMEYILPKALSILTIIFYWPFEHPIKEPFCNLDFLKHLLDLAIYPEHSMSESRQNALPVASLSIFQSEMNMDIHTRSQIRQYSLTSFRNILIYSPSIKENFCHDECYELLLKLYDEISEVPILNELNVVLYLLFSPLIENPQIICNDDLRKYFDSLLNSIVVDEGVNTVSIDLLNYILDKRKDLIDYDQIVHNIHLDSLLSYLDNKNFVCRIFRLLKLIFHPVAPDTFFKNNDLSFLLPPVSPLQKHNNTIVVEKFCFVKFLISRSKALISDLAKIHFFETAMSYLVQGSVDEKVRALIVLCLYFQQMEFDELIQLLQNKIIEKIADVVVAIAPYPKVEIKVVYFLIYFMEKVSSSLEILDELSSQLAETGLLDLLYEMQDSDVELLSKASSVFVEDLENLTKG